MTTTTITTETAYMHPKGLADRWLTSVSRLATLRSEGRSPVPYIKVTGGHVLYPVEAVLAYEEELLQAAQVAA